MKTAYLIIYDNDGCNGDYFYHPVLACETKERAFKVLQELDDWVREAIRNCPDTSREARLQYIESLKPPYGVDQLTLPVISNHYRPIVALSIREVPLL